MSEYEVNRSLSVEAGNDTLDDAAGGSADNSIIGKVKSRVSSILPNSLSKWFSPSSAAATTAKNNNDSINGNLLNAGSNVGVAGIARRRRRLEIEDEDEDDDDEEVVEEEEEDEEIADDEQQQTHGLLRPQVDDNSDEESNNSDEETTATALNASHLNSRRSLNATTALRQPPAKRTRLSFNLTNTRDNTLLHHQPLVASTPAIGSNQRSNLNTHSPQTAQTRSTSRYSYMNLYGQQDKREPAYNFHASNIKEMKFLTKSNVDSNESMAMQATNANTNVNNAESKTITMSSRRSLNIPTTSQARTEHYTGFGSLKRQSLAMVKNDLPNFAAHDRLSPKHAAVPRRTSTTIVEIEDDDDNDDNVGCYINAQHKRIMEETATTTANSDEALPTKYNGRSAMYAHHKRQRLINGISATGVSNETENNNETNLIDTASESSDGAVVLDSMNLTRANNASMQRKTGLFNMSTANSSRNGSRTSSFGNGLNFYSHLEGRKSLFAGTQGTTATTASAMQALNNSTLSLTSLNRRQFNASIYGSTSALSDSRLLNTFSPFYKGNTTYGGAAAYNKYKTGAGANAVRITPTLIRPTSSLSTLSTSSNSLAATGAAHTAGENTSAISSTAKRILDLINDFATPLSEAKKMAGNLKLNQQQLLPQTKSRLNDGDLQASRAMRLTQVRTPYMRPIVTLQPTHINGGKTATGGSTTFLPPVRELQVPSMSQILQMKKMQSTTERSRQIATQNSSNTMQSGASAEYTLPMPVETNDRQKQSLQQQKHTNKIKSKGTSSMRVTGTKDTNMTLADSEPPPPVNLPNIAFPLMQSVPKFDIPLPTIIADKSSIGTANTKVVNKFGNTAVTTTSAAAAAATTTFAFNTTKQTNSSNNTSPFARAAASHNAFVTPNTTSNTTSINFKFSAPLDVKGVPMPTQNVAPYNGNYKFSAPTLLSDTGSFNLMPKQQIETRPQLKSGSVLDALKKPFTLPKTATTTIATTSTTTPISTVGFGAQFKKSGSEWECDSCMVRNKQEVGKCVACETPRKTAAPTATVIATTTPIASTTIASTFGAQFKKSSSEWECDSCMIRNKQEAQKCVACETPRKGATATTTTTTPTPTISQLPTFAAKNSFGDQFKPKANTWECSTCLIMNKNDANECVACQTKKPGAANNINSGTVAQPKSAFKFGFAAAATDATTATKAMPDAAFKTLAAEQKASKWECEACMTRNDATRSKCVCCEQSKPGTQTVSDNVPKFTFGTTAAAKFSFGFAAATDAQKPAAFGAVSKADTTTTTQKTDTASNGGFVFGISAPATVAAPAPSGGFTFGLKTAASTDVADSSKTIKTSTALTTATAKTTPGKSVGFQFGINANATSTAVTSTTDVNVDLTKSWLPTTTTGKSSPSKTSGATLTTVSPSVKFNLPSTTTTTTIAVPATVSTTATAAAAKNDTPPAPKFMFGGATPATTLASTSFKPVAGFSFGSTAKTTETSKPLAQTAAAANAGFAFKIPATSAASTNASAPAAAVKSTFSFGVPISTATAAAAAATVTSTTTTSTATTAVSKGGFSFGAVGSSSITAPAATTVKSPIFGAVPVTTHIATTTSATPTLADSNVFGTFGTATGATTTPSLFGVASNMTTTTPAAATATKIATTTPSTSSTFGSFGSGGSAGTTNSANTTSSANIFGTFGAQNETKPTATAAPLFGSSAIGVASSTTTSTWPKNNFVFGNVASGTTVSSASQQSAADGNAKPVFGSFGATQPAVGTTTVPSIFGNLSSTASTPSVPTFGSASTQSTTIFGPTSTPAATPGGNVGGTTNLFGAAPSSNALTPAPATFGSSPFGGSSSNTAHTPIFGSTAASASTFGGFGTASATAANTTDGASAAKKSETAFNFGGTAANTQNTSGGFNFGASAASKPAFSFTSNNQPAFNFTGATTEATPNAPFQFNAGAATPASSNIFAPPPNPGATQTAQQARRKIRAPIRRLTPR